MAEINTSRAVHEFSRNNEKLVKKSKKVGCFYCLKIYPAKEITTYRSYNGAAVCVKCKVDSIIPDKAPGITLTDEFLKAMAVHWFNK